MRNSNTEYKMYFPEKSKTSMTKNKPIQQEVAAIFTGKDSAPPNLLRDIEADGHVFFFFGWLAMKL